MNKKAKIMICCKAAIILTASIAACFVGWFGVVIGVANAALTLPALYKKYKTL